MSTLIFQNGMRAVVAALLIVASFMQNTAWADEPQYVLRTFAFASFEQNLPDFQGDDSLAVVVMNDSNSWQWGITLLGFGDGETVWRGHQARHVTIGGKQIQGSFLWLVEDELVTPPPVGAISLTGPDGMVESVFEAGISPCGSECGSGSAGKWRISDTDTGTYRVVFVRAWFLR